MFHFDNSYASELEGFYVSWKGDVVPNPEIVQFNRPLAEALGLDGAALDSPEGAAFFAGSKAPAGAAPLAQVYAGHQFGGFSPRLGDGRALLIGEVIDPSGLRRDIHLKGSGRTPFSRGGDGKAVLGPVLREYLMGEAMHALGIPTTRALAAVTTGEQVARETLLPGAVLARVASSHLRVGTFQYFAAQRDGEKLRKLADYAIRRHDPDLAERADRYLSLLRRVLNRQASLVAKWVSVGFVHGVMNTDNMTISGETIDYGPCAFMDIYDPKTVFSSIDEQGRYAYGNQPVIMQWNIARFAETLLALINPDDIDSAVQLATDEINTILEIYQRCWLQEMRAKLGLAREDDRDLELVNDLFSQIETASVDYTQLFRRLADAARGEPGPLRALLKNSSGLDPWLDRWHARLQQEDGGPSAGAAAMDRVNPLYIPRNHLVEAALQSAQNDSDFAPFEELLQVLAAPFTQREGLEKFEKPAPDNFGHYTTFCGT